MAVFKANALCARRPVTGERGLACGARQAGGVVNCLSFAHQFKSHDRALHSASFQLHVVLVGAWRGRTMYVVRHQYDRTHALHEQSSCTEPWLEVRAAK